MMKISIFFVTDNEIIENTTFEADNIEVCCNGYVTTVTATDKKTIRSIMFPSERFVCDLIDERQIK